MKIINTYLDGIDMSCWKLRLEHSLVVCFQYTQRNRADYVVSCVHFTTGSFYLHLFLITVINLSYFFVQVCSICYRQFLFSMWIFFLQTEFRLT